MIFDAEVPVAIAQRLGRIRIGLLTLFAAMLGYLFDMQALRAEQFREQAANNSMRRRALDAPRGLIRDREGRILVKNRPAFDAFVLADRIVDVDATVARAARALGLSEPRRERLRKSLTSRARPEILVKEDLSLAEVSQLEARALEWDEFRVHEGLVRQYAYGPVAAHLLGHMGEIREGQLGHDQFRDYRAGNVIGQTGLEARYEHHLRGRDGHRLVQVNSRGREIRSLNRVEPPRSGLDLILTIDLDVQRATEEAFGDQRGAAVALGPRTGAILALVSRPAYDPNEFAGKLSSEVWRSYRNDPHHPLFDRALLASHPPGSVFKIVDALAGLEERVWDPDAEITCKGATVVHRDLFRCWRGGGHGPVDLHAAIRSSCNVFFYHRGDQLGIDVLALWSRRLGLGVPTGLDLDGEGSGLVPDRAWKRRTYDEPWWPGETVSVAIGQGALQVSVLQVAGLLQIVASGGVAHMPHLVASVGATGFQREPVVARDVSLQASSLERVRRALWAVVNEEKGTGRRARVVGADVHGKTGTAQVPPGSAPDDVGEHAWFAGYAPGSSPQVVGVVLVERGEHGGETAAPIARVIFETVLEKSGFVPAMPPESPVARLARSPRDDTTMVSQVVADRGDEAEEER